jgi:hypothetical protein
MSACKSLQRQRFCGDAGAVGSRIRVDLPETVFLGDGRAPRQNCFGLLQEIRQVRIIGFRREQRQQRLVAKGDPPRGGVQVGEIGILLLNSQ